MPLSDPPEEGYLFIANVSYMTPVKNVIGVYADTKEDAEEMLRDTYGNQLNFELHTLEIAPDDIKRAYKKGTIN